VAFDCLLAVTDCIRNKSMSVEDLIIATAKNFWSLLDCNKEKFLLLVNWGLFYKAFEIKSIDEALIIELAKNCIGWIGDGKGV
jgi:hypothetical protein